MDKEKRAEDIAEQILKYSRNELLVSLRFIDLALCKLEYKRNNFTWFGTDGKYLFYNPLHIFELYEEGNEEMNHAHLHAIFHCIFYHPFVKKNIDMPQFWDLACDIAVEGIISEFHMKQLTTSRSVLIDKELEDLKAKYGRLTAQRLYRKFLEINLDQGEVERLNKIFVYDDHYAWYVEKKGKSKEKVQVNLTDQENEDDDLFEQLDIDMESLREEWEKISERVKVDIETSSKEWGDRSANLMQNITEVNREKYDYSSFLQKFAVMGEEMRINDDEFDYIFYTYGLQLYDNVPLVEPLEYKDVKKIKEFAIVIDTSGSVQGDLIKRFISKTYNILSQQSNFFTKVNIHVIQCDNKIEEDYRIACPEDFEELINNFQVKGFGGTDFRPAFEYVDDLIEKGEFENLKGLIYLTDGYGHFPDRKPDYDTAFVFIDDEWGQPEIPVWAIKLVLAQDEI